MIGLSEFLQKLDFRFFYRCTAVGPDLGLFTSSALLVLVPISPQKHLDNKHFIFGKSDSASTQRAYL